MTGFDGFSGGADIFLGFNDWLSKKHPDIGGGFLDAIGLYDAPNANTKAMESGFAQAGMKAPPLQGLNLQQLMQMAQSYMGQPQQRQPMGLMEPKKPFTGGLWS